MKNTKKGDRTNCSKMWVVNVSPVDIQCTSLVKSMQQKLCQMAKRSSLNDLKLPFVFHTCKL